jgi:penicillin G amidase
LAVAVRPKQHRCATHGAPSADAGGLALTALRHLLDTFSVSGGVGASGVNFFNVPAVTSAADRRDIVILKGLSDALVRLASPDFAPAFGGSTKLGDYRWGNLHRIVFAPALDGPFSIPPAGGVPASVTGLPGIATDGGFEVLDRSDSDVRATVRTPSCSAQVRRIEASTWQPRTA